VIARDPVALGLPHREPFIFLDEVLTLTPGERGTATKAFPPGTPFFSGHFPGDPLVPGVILTEALAQLSGIVAGQRGRALRLAAIKGMKFRRAVRPAEVIALSAEKSGNTGGLWQFTVEARVDGEVVAEGVIVLAEPPVT